MLVILGSTTSPPVTGNNAEANYKTTRRKQIGIPYSTDLEQSLLSPS